MKPIDQLHREWLALQPLRPEDQKRLDDKFMLEFNYNSNHIEGNTLTYGQTKLALFFDKFEGVGNLRDYREMTAHNVGLRSVRELAEDLQQPLTEKFIRDLNHVILVEDFWKVDPRSGNRYEIHVGVYKKRPNSVITASGEEFMYASPEETSVMMYELVGWLNEQIDAKVLTPVELAALFHYRYIRIHPFEDGNGRIARLLMNYILLRMGFPLVIIKSADKSRYLDVLNICDVNSGLTPSDGANASIENIAPFVEYVENELEWSLRIAINAAKGESIEEEDDFAKQLKMLQRQAVNKNNKIKFSSEEFWNILEYCFFPICVEIYKALKPTEAFFYQGRAFNYLFRKGGEQGLEIVWIERVYTDTLTAGYITNAKEVKWQYVLTGGKQEYFDTDFRITEEFRISFAEDSYSIHYGKNETKQFDYQRYPSASEIETIVAGYKASVLNKIETNIKR